MRGMISSVKHGSGSLLLLLLLFLSALPACSAEPHAGVKWYEGLALGDARASTSKQWQELLAQPWRLGGDPVTLSVRKNGSEAITVDRCSKLFDAVGKGMQAGGPDQAIFDGWMVKCDAVRSLIGATAPKQDFLGDFTLDERGIKALPVGVAFQISRDDERKVASIKSAGGSLGDYLGSVTLKALGNPEDRRMIVRDGRGATQLLSVLAEGDFDHDGINDLLISSSNSMTGGSYHAAHLYIVSRLKAEGPLVLRKQLR